MATRFELSPCDIGPPCSLFVLPIGGDKTADKRFYDRMIPVADDLYDEHLAGLEKEKDDGR